MEDVKKTVLYDKHMDLNAKMAPFAGYMMPIQYNTGIIKEHNTVRNDVGMFDISHMGEFFIKGKDSEKFLNYIMPQNINSISNDGAIYCHLTNEFGGVIDDFITYNIKNFSEFNYLLVVNASGIKEDFDHIKSLSKDFDVEIVNRSEELSMIALQGPNASKKLEELGLNQNNQPKFFNITKAKLKNLDCIIIRGGYTGEDGFEIILNNDDAPKLWDELIKLNISPIGLGARDTLRLEAALPLYGHELNSQTTPIESSLGFFIPKEKEEDYIGKELIQAQKNKQKPLRRRLLPFKMQERQIARNGCEVYLNNKKIGLVTSGAPSPILGANIGFCMIEFENLDKDIVAKLNNPQENIGIQLQIMIRNKLYNASIVKKPFVEKHYKK